MAPDAYSQKIKALELRFRDGTFHAVFEVAGQMVEVVLHGVSSFEDALRAIADLTSTRALDSLAPMPVSSC